MLRMNKLFAGFVIWVMCVGFCAPVSAEGAQAKGLWVTCIGDSRVLESRAAIDKAVAFAKKNGFSTIFVQVFRADKAWFDSAIADASPFKENRKKAGTDTLKVLIDAAHEQGIEVHAWINTLTLSANRNAKLLHRAGNRILTKDQHGRAALTDAKDKWDEYYQREEQLFLEPGDPTVRDHVIGVVKEIATKYPKLDGIHFDYIRYPAAPPYIPGSRFNYVGISYGYGRENVKRFKAKHKKDPHKLSFAESAIWDDWKREQVTSLIREAAKEARAANPKLQISSAVLAAYDRAYLASYQEWPRWVSEGIVDFVVLMNYSKDTRYVAYMTKAARGLAGAKVRVGLGAYLLAEKPQILKAQIQDAAATGTGVVLFDYDSLLGSPELAAAARS